MRYAWNDRHSKRELDALDFGSLVHQVVEDFGRDEVARELADPTAIHNYFVEQLRTLIATRYGSKLPCRCRCRRRLPNAGCRRRHARKIRGGLADHRHGKRN